MNPDIVTAINVKSKPCEKCGGSGYICEIHSNPVKLWNGYMSGTCSISTKKCPDCNNQMQVFYTGNNWEETRD